MPTPPQILFALSSEVAITHFNLGTFNSESFLVWSVKSKKRETEWLPAFKEVKNKWDERNWGHPLKLFSLEESDESFFCSAALTCAGFE